MAKKENLKIVTVANNLETFDEVIKNNEKVKDFEKFLYDNSNENIGIPKRYNSFINENVKPDSDFWIIFCHQDFGFNKNPLNIIKKFDKNNIYGAIGTISFFSPIRALKKKIMNKSQNYLANKRLFLGQIKQNHDNNDIKTFGRKILWSKNVDNLDCCCIIVHSSLINKYNLRFDENLDWHMYVEDFCYNVRFNHKIKVKAAQFDCFHLGAGILNDSFYRAVAYVKQKYHMKHISTTCIDE